MPIRSLHWQGVTSMFWLTLAILVFLASAETVTTTTSDTETKAIQEILGRRPAGVSLPSVACTQETRQFVLESIASGQPLVLRQAAHDWKALTTWTADHLRTVHGPQVASRELMENEPIFVDGKFSKRYDAEEMASLGVIYEEDPDIISWMVKNATASKVLRQDTLPLPCLPDIPPGTDERPREMMFLAHGVGKGREPHIDYSCSNVLSAEIRGDKLWELWHPRHCDGIMAQETGISCSMSVSGQDEDAVDDSDTSSTIKAYHTVLQPGDVVLWYAGWTHSTACLGEECVALSMEYDEPIPLRLYEDAKSMFDAHSQLLDSYTACF